MEPIKTWKPSLHAKAASKAVALIALYVLSPGACHADVTTSRVAGLAYLVTQQTGEGSWKPVEGLDVPATAEALTALYNVGMNTQGPYSRGVSWLANAKTTSVDALARKIIALKQAGLDTTLHTTNLLDWRSNSSENYGVYGYFWGAYPGYGPSYPDTVLGLAAQRVSVGYANPAQPTVDHLAPTLDCEVLRSQHTDGGWSYSSRAISATLPESTPSIVMPTAYTLLELKEVSATWTSSAKCGTNYVLASALTNGLNFIFSKRNADGGFGENSTSSPLETALAYRVIKKLAPADIRAMEALNWLLTNQNVDGSWSGGAFITALVLASFDPVSLPDTDHDGVPDAVEVRLGTNPNISDARYIANGSGQVTSGLTVPIMLANEIMLGVPFNFSLSAYGGKQPYTWTLGTGTPPPGLSMNTVTGVISGTPTQIGDYSFTYVVTDASASPVSQITSGHISVYISPPLLADGDINGDGIVNVADFMLAVRFATGLAVPTTTQMRHADVYPAGNPDGVVDVRDFQLISNRAFGK